MKKSKPKKFYILTLFPQMMEQIFSHSMIWKAQKNKLVEIELIDLRKFGLGSRRQVDDAPYGGGGGMVLKPEPIYTAIESIKKSLRSKRGNLKIILLTPQGVTFDQLTAEKMSKSDDQYLLICGHYEGFDERIRKLADVELSIGNFVLTGGELAAATVVDAVTRLIPGVLGAERGAEVETFSKELEGGIEYPHYTRPENFKGMKVPKVLLSGDHAKVALWRKAESLKKTQKLRKI